MEPTHALFLDYFGFLINFYRHRPRGKGALITSGVIKLLALMANASKKVG
jgi:hypothetical protein